MQWHLKLPGNIDDEHGGTGSEKPRIYGKFYKNWLSRKVSPDHLE